MKMTTRAFSLNELLLVLGILAFVAALLVPVYNAGRAKARTVACGANLRQIGNALQSYALDNDGIYPPSSQDTYVNGNGQNPDALLWEDLLLPYCGKSFPACPDRFVPSFWDAEMVKRPNLCGYAYNLHLGGAFVPKPGILIERGTPENAVTAPSLTVAVFDSRIDYPARALPDTDAQDEVIGGASPAAFRHQNGANYLFVDGHVKWFKPTGLRTGKKSDGVHPGFGL